MNWLVGIFAAMGIPSAIFGMFVWYLKKRIDKNEKRREDQEKTRERMLLMMMKSERENTALCVAIAKAVQRIPDAHCNGDMTAALERAKKASEEEKNFLIEHGVMHIFE